MVAPTLLGGLLLASCATGVEDDAWSESLAQHAIPAGASLAFSPESLTSTLPSTTYVGDVGADEFHYSHSVVTGSFVSSENGSAIDWSAGEGEEVDWDSDRADTRDLQLTLEVADVIDELETSDVEPGQAVTVRVTVDGADDPGAVAAGLLSIDQALVFLTRHPHNPYDGGWTIALSGALVGSVDPDTGRFDLPVLDVASRLGDVEGLGIVRDAVSIDDLLLAGTVEAEVVVQDGE